MLGFPVHLDLSFVLIMAVLGYSSGLTSPIGMALWLAITPVAVLVHELGHALLARAAGARPQIALAGFGGVTTFSPPRPLSRLRSLGISLAGPGVGLAIGLLIVLIYAVLDDAAVAGWTGVALRIGIWTCIGWSVLNLLPVLPLDGGQAMRELLPGSPQVRARRAAVVSVVVAVGAAGVAYRFDQVFVAVFLLFFALSNVLELRQSSERAPSRVTAPHPQNAVIDLLWRGEPEAARQALEALPPGSGVDLAVHGAVLMLTGDPAGGAALLDQEVARRPQEADPVALRALALALAHDWNALVSAVHSESGVAVPATVVDRAAAEATAAGRPDVVELLTRTRPSTP